MIARWSPFVLNVSKLPVPRGRVYRDDEERLFQESRNGVVLAEFTIYRASNWADPSTSLTPELFCKAQEITINQLYRCAGIFRDGPVTISGVDHVPPESSEVEGLVTDMCAYVIGGWNEKTPIHLAAYIMWRTNWIHPFFGGNGRTARAISYMVLSARLGFVLPGDEAIPQLIDASYRGQYYDGLRAADKAYAEHGKVDARALESLVEEVLADQLLRVHHLATGRGT